MIAHLIAAAAVVATPAATLTAVDVAKARLRRAHHCRRTRRHGTMLQRPRTVTR